MKIITPISYSGRIEMEIQGLDVREMNTPTRKETVPASANLPYFMETVIDITRWEGILN